MRKLSRIVLLLLAIVAGFVLDRQLRLPTPAAASPSVLTIQQIQPLSMLISSRLSIADVQVNNLSGHVGGLKLVLVIKGDVLLGVDLGQGCLEQIDPQHRTAVLLLPGPQASSPRLDHDRSRIYALDTQGLWHLVPGDAARERLINYAYGQAQASVAAAAAEPQLVRQARRQAEAVLGTYFQAIGWTVEIRWGG